MKTNKRAPRFAEKLRKLVGEAAKKQRILANELSVSTTSLNRLLKHGIGSDDKVCILLTKLGLKNRDILEILVQRRLELSNGVTKQVWQTFQSAPSDEEVIDIIACCPVNLANAAARAGKTATTIVHSARASGIQSIEARQSLNGKIPDVFYKFLEAKSTELLSRVERAKCGEWDSLFFMDLEEVDASSFVQMSDCKGQMLFGVSNTVIGKYEFDLLGEMKVPRAIGGVEFLLSSEGKFEISYNNYTYKEKRLTSRELCVLHARQDHSIKHVGSSIGRLMVVNYYPYKKEVTPAWLCSYKKTHSNESMTMKEVSKTFSTMVAQQD